MSILQSDKERDRIYWNGASRKLYQVSSAESTYAILDSLKSFSVWFDQIKDAMKLGFFSWWLSQFTVETAEQERVRFITYVRENQQKEPYAKYLIYLWPEFITKKSVAPKNSYPNMYTWWSK